jgi:tRNA nucleotidyltransferase (CCA-adding enzyme)
MPMQVYLVGGAVRDRLLGLPVRERDWVVVGATPEEMLALGSLPVGKDFPVFLHPETKEEYALARTERKTGPGYTGFAVHADPDVTLEDDLLRRDLTINAMAETPDGELIDPYGGKDDLDNGILRHVSPAFAEDPVRILRIARFAARFSRWGFHVAHATNKLLRNMVASGEVDQLVPERVWAELAKALAEAVPVRFFEVLHGCGALARLFPELEPLYPDAGHAGKHPSHKPLPVLQAAVGLSDETAVRWAALICDIDNADPTALDKPRLKILCERLRTPNACRELALLALQYRRQAHEIANLSPAAVLDLLTALDALRRADRLDDFLLVCEADARSRDAGLLEYLPARWVLQVRQACLQVRAPAGKHGPEIAAIMRARRIEAIKQLLA